MFRKIFGKQGYSRLYKGVGIWDLFRSLFFFIIVFGFCIYSYFELNILKVFFWFLIIVVLIQISSKLFFYYYGWLMEEVFQCLGKFIQEFVVIYVLSYSFQFVFIWESNYRSYKLFLEVLRKQYFFKIFFFKKVNVFFIICNFQKMGKGFSIDGVLCGGVCVFLFGRQVFFWC